MPTTHADTPTLTRQAVRTALVELLTTGQHHHAATPATLTTIGHARQALAAHYHGLDPASRDASYERRLAALTHALGGIGEALFTATTTSYRQQPDPTRIHTALTELAAISLGWLDILPDPTTDDEPEFLLPPHSPADPGATRCRPRRPGPAADAPSSPTPAV